MGKIQPKHSFLKSGLVISLMTFLSRILGLVRDIVIARYFGVSTGTDAFFVAFRIPNFLRRLFAEGAFSQAFVPILADSKAKQTAEKTQVLINSIGTYLLKILVIITIIAVLIAPLIILVFAFGFYSQPEKFSLASTMLRITFPYLLFISLAAFLGAILNVYQRFAVPAFTPVLLNISLILSAVFLSRYFAEPIMALAWGVLLGGIAQLLFQIPFLKKIKRLPRLRWQKIVPHPAINTLKKRMLPAMFGVSVTQINLLIDTIIASFLITGSISWLYYADRLLEFPLALIGISLATLSLTKLSEHFAKQDRLTYQHTLSKALNLGLMIGLPAMVALIVLAEPLMITLFQYENFSPKDAHQSALALMAYALGLVVLIFVKILAPAFYAIGDVKTPVKVGVVAMVSNIFLNLMLVNYLGHIGLALATSLAAVINAFLLYHYLVRDKIYQLPRSFYQLGLQSLLATIIMLGSIYGFGLSTLNYAQLDVYYRIVYLGTTIVLGIATYFLSLFLFGGIKTIKKTLK